MSDVTLSYKGSDILELSDSGSATLKTGGKYCEDDIAVEYVKPSGGGTSALELWLIDYINGNLPSHINADFPEITTLRKCAFRLDTATSAIFPYVTSCSASTFDSCGNLEYLVLPRCDANGLGSMANLKVLDIGGSINPNGMTAPKLTTIVLRKSVALATTVPSVMNSTPAKQGGAGITVYIPKVFYDHLGDGTSLDYKSATNWSLYEGYGTITWAKIEGSYYETHYADGTVITA